MCSRIGVRVDVFRSPHSFGRGANPTLDHLDGYRQAAHPQPSPELAGVHSGNLREGVLQEILPVHLCVAMMTAMRWHAVRFDERGGADSWTVASGSSWVRLKNLRRGRRGRRVESMKKNPSGGSDVLRRCEPRPGAPPRGCASLRYIQHGSCRSLRHSLSPHSPAPPILSLTSIRIASMPAPCGTWSSFSWSKNQLCFCMPVSLKEDKGANKEQEKLMSESTGSTGDAPVPRSLASRKHGRHEEGENL